MNESCPLDDIVYASAHQPGRVYAMIHDANYCEDVTRFHTIGCSAQTRLTAARSKFRARCTRLSRPDSLKAIRLTSWPDKMGFTGAEQGQLLPLWSANELYDKQNDEDFGKLRLPFERHPHRLLLRLLAGASLTTGAGHCHQ